jgi:hypothetical protein
MRIARNLFFLLILIIYSNNLFAQDKPTGSLAGRVLSKMNEKPLVGVTVRVLGTNLGTFTRANGTFRIDNIPPGVYAIQFTYVGYETYINANTNIPSGKTVTLDIYLTESVIRLEGAEVRSSYFIKKAETVTSTQTLNSEDIRRAPGVQEDVLRATQLLPGVAVTSAGRNDLIVRGGAPFENLYVVDNIEVPNINHFGSQGTGGGPLSIVNIDFVREVSFSAGAFGAKYGDKLSSITNISLRNGNEEQFGGKATLSATGFGLNLEGPINSEGSFLFSARRSYLDLIFEAAGFGFIPEYWDFHAKFNQRLNSSNTLTFLTIGAIGSVKLNNDDSDKRFDNSRVAVPNQKQYFSGLTWKHLFENGYTTVTLGQTFTDYSTFQNDSNLVKILKNDSREAETSLRTDVDIMLGKTSQLTFGNQLKWATRLQYDLFIDGFFRTDNNGIPQTLSVDTNFSSYKNATYISLTQGIDNFKFTLGGRLDYVSYVKDKWLFSPRFSFLYQINEVSAISLSGGQYYQSPSKIWLIGAPTNNSLKAIRGEQLVLAYDHTPLEDVKVQVEVYHKWYSNYPARLWRPFSVLAPTGFDDASSDIPFGLEPIASKGKGYSRGFELFVQKKLSEIPLYGLMSFTLSESKFKSLQGGYRPSTYDSRFIFNLAAGYRFNQEWEVSSKFRIASGQPTTPYLTNGQRDWDQYNLGKRLPTFHALDLRIDKRWNFTRYTLITYVDIQNLYGRKNVSTYRWNPRTQSIDYGRSIGVLPSIGVSFEF